MVSIEGDIWRWDGYTSRAKEDEVGNKIYAKNRLGIIDINLLEGKKIFDHTSKEHNNVKIQLLKHKEEESQLRSKRKNILENQDTLQNKITNIEQTLWNEKEILISQSQKKQFLEESISQYYNILFIQVNRLTMI